MFSHGGVVCTGETYKNVVEMTSQGSRVKGPGGSIQLRPRRKCKAGDDIHEGEKVDEAALKDLIGGGGA